MMEHNWAKVTQIVICIVYTIFILFDVVIIIEDSNSGPDVRTNFEKYAYTVLKWLQTIYNLTIINCYLVLFILFLMLIRRSEELLGSLNRQVISFFSFMLGLLIINFVLDIVFYVNFDPTNVTDSQKLSQEKLVSITLYIHSGIEILLDLFLLGFLISQASEPDSEILRTGTVEQGSILYQQPESRQSNRRSSPMIIKGLGSGKLLDQSNSGAPLAQSNRTFELQGDNNMPFS